MLDDSAMERSLPEPKENEREKIVVELVDRSINC